MLLENKVIWITGASRGIGKASALRLASEGALLVLAARDEAKLNETADEIEQQGCSRPLVLPYDVSNVQSVKEAFGMFLKHHKRLDAMVNNAGILEEALLPMITPEQVDRIFAINVYATIYHMQYASRIMMRNKSGSIINLSSIIGQAGKEGLTVYGASKAAIVGATLSASKELAPFNIRVNAIAPGFIDTDMVQTLSEQKYQERVSAIKMRRAGTPEEVANTVVYLSSELSTYVTGQLIGVNGGMLE
ncbi:SDR family oxidoreductase [Paenibacillus oenotherae]|uniref:SDR family oxidoreductase n=1 Tax=Paenibacillus oenotherae TaxID=1435645 RepID=A0ABS7D6D0_9BACL|nr:SDR family NAD(P)-dependent oxidoreductase [Paenibacillus oenotherae]MBW7475056.1 SDR family oxidoreductase [Paenibacillus oenotherae]